MTTSTPWYTLFESLTGYVWTIYRSVDILSIDAGCTAVLIDSLYFIYSWLFILLIEHLQLLSKFPTITKIVHALPSKLPLVFRNQPWILHNKPIFTQRRQWANPRHSLILNIEGNTDHHRLKSWSEWKQKYLPYLTIENLCWIKQCSLNRGFNCRTSAVWCLFICLYLSITSWVFCCWKMITKDHNGDFRVLYFHALREKKKKSL